MWEEREETDLSQNRRRILSIVQGQEGYGWTEMLWKIGIREDMPHGWLTMLADLYFNILRKDYVTDQ